MDQAERTERGDLIVIHGHRLGEPSRTGEILEVMGVPEHQHYRVRWDDGHEALFYPGNDAVIKHVRNSPGAPRRGR